MARYTGPKHKHCRAEGVPLCGLPTCPVVKKNAGPPGEHGQKRRGKISEYGVQLREKQKVKRMYGVLERQFRKNYNLASKQKGMTGETLLSLMERRLDNTVYRLNLASTRQQARQFASHGHILVNGKKVTIPSYNVKIGDVISLSEKAASLDFIKKLTENTKGMIIPSWLEKKAIVGKVVGMPKREDLEAEINENLIVEYYSR